ncbi:NHLP-related RiPP peptide [Streptomyces termitum]|uniref:NHLP-related RiPP peptide n=1 Tax=Streptomyces termitum TaxID=67368 RepID=UPI0033B77F44
MMRTHAPENEKTRLPADVIDRLLDLLSTDDHFRELFTRDRHAALALAGCDLTAEQLRAAAPLRCLTVRELAGKETIARAREELRAHLLSDAAYSNPHALEAGAVPTALLRD